jgi:hypothetical protein
VAARTIAQSANAAQPVDIATPMKARGVA